MGVAVIAVPELLADDVERLQRLRARHDVRRHALVAAHLTLVFPTGAIDAAALVAHVKASIGAVNSFAFSLRCAMPVFDPLSGRTHVFIVPDRGFSEFVRLHDLLYVGRLAGELRLDLPYIPHIGVGEFEAPAHAKRLADELNEKGVSIFGTVSSLAVVSVAPDKVEEVARIELAAARGVPSGRLH